jgi:hypothetical protein
MASCHSEHADCDVADALKRKLTQSQEAQILFNSLELRDEEQNTEKNNEKDKKYEKKMQTPKQTHVPQPNTVRIEVPDSEIALVFSQNVFTIERQKEGQQHAWKMELPTLDDVLGTGLLDDWFHRFQINSRFTERRPPQHLIITKNNSFRFGACIAPANNVLLWQSYETGLCINVDTFQLKADTGDLDPKQWLSIGIHDQDFILRNKCKQQFHTFIREIVNAHCK